MKQRQVDTVQTRNRGTMQGERMLPALSPDSVLVDEKSLSGNLQFLYAYSGMIKLVDTSNAVAGSWQQMLEQDASFLVASIATVSLEHFPPLYAATMNTLQGRPSLEEQEVALSLLFGYTDTLATNLAEWVARSSGTATDAQALGQTLAQLICTYVGNRLNSWSACLDTMLGLMTLNASTITHKDLYNDVAGAMTYLGPLTQQCSGYVATEATFPSLQDCTVYLSDLYQSLYRCNVQVRDQLSGGLRATYLQTDHEPHNALLLAFQEMMGTATAALNTLTKRHLDFYYEDVLRLAPLPPIPDSAFVQFTLNKGISSAIVPAQTALVAGKGPSGANIIYLTDSTLYVNRTEVAQYLTVFNSGASNPGTSQGLLNASPVANSADGMGAAFAATAPAEWPPFGFAPPTNPAAQTLVGFALADPVLLMSTGSRTISLALSLQQGDAPSLIAALAAWLPPPIGTAKPSTCPFSLTYTGEKGWAQVSSWQLLSSPSPNSAVPMGNAPAAGKCLWLEASLDVNAAAIVGYALAVHGPGYVPGVPVLRFQLDASLGSEGQEGPSVLENPYNLLQQVTFSAIDIRVAVQGKTDLALQNDFSNLNAEKPFQPLGPAPILDSSLYIGSPEAFRKQLQSLAVHVTWMQLPTVDPSGFRYYYQIWNQFSPKTPFFNTVFRVAVSLLQQNQWVLLPPAVTASTLKPATDFQMYALGPAPANTASGSFDAYAWLQDNGWTGAAAPATSKTDKGGVLQTESTWTDFDLSRVNEAITQIPASSLGTAFPYTSGLATGFLKINLSGPSYGFGSAMYSEVAFLVNQANIEAISSSASSGSPPGKPQIIAPPALPYVPIAKALTIDYVAVGRYAVNENNAGWCFAIQPFGVIQAQAQQGAISMVPQYAAEGTLYLGLANVKAPQLVTLLVQLDENSAITQAGVPLPVVNWSYLVGETWTPFSSTEIVADGTNNFSQSGILQLMLNVGPSGTAPANGNLPTQGGWFNAIAGADNLLWIAGVVAADTAATCKVILMGTQAVSATYQLSADSATVLAQPLPAGSITKMALPVAGVASVTQPMSSVGGRLGETAAQFYTRVHERLRHKARAITPWDIERILLEQFPNVGLVNCFPHSSPESGLVPGSSLVVVFPAGSLATQANPYCPKFTLAALEAMQGYLEELVPHDMNAVISNPTYELLTVRASVLFMPGLDPGTYLIQLNSDLCNFISPWVNAPGAYNPYDTLLSTALLRGFINGLSYILQLGSVQVLHSTNVAGRAKHFLGLGDYDYFEPKSPFAILTSAMNHELSEMATGSGGMTLVVAATPEEGEPILGNAIVSTEIGSPPTPTEREYLAIIVN